MCKPMTLTVPMPPNRGNARGHSVVANITKKQYWAMLDELQQYGLVPPPPRHPIPRAALTSTMYLGAWMDDDNAVARHKIVLDWLVTRGYLAGDRKKHLRWTGFPSQVVRRTHEYRIALTLTPEEQ